MSVSPAVATPSPAAPPTPRPEVRDAVRALLMSTQSFGALPPETGAALLDGALGWLEARLVSEREAGDHTWFVGGIVSTETGSNAPALVHVGGAFRSL